MVRKVVRRLIRSPGDPGLLDLLAIVVAASVLASMLSCNGSARDGSAPVSGEQTRAGGAAAAAPTEAPQADETQRTEHAEPGQGGGQQADTAPPDATPSPGVSAAPATAGAAADGQGADVGLPTGFPDDIPIYPGVRVTGSVAAAGRGTVVTFQSPDPGQQVFAFYRAGLIEQGWSIDGEASLLGQGVLSGTKGERAVSLVIVGTGEATQIIVTASAPQ